MMSQLRTAAVALILLTLVTGVLYPLVVTGAARLLFPDQAGGSLLVRDGRVLGSRLIGQDFHDPRWFWARPSATLPGPANAMASGGSNLALTNPALAATIERRLAALRASDPANPDPVPVDLVTASGSGLDPHISPAAAHWQVARVARLRGLDVTRLHALVEAAVERPALGLLGCPRVNVLELNVALDSQH